MNKFNLAIATFACAVLAGCAGQQTMSRETGEMPLMVKPKEVDVNFYARQLTHDILTNIRHVKPTATIATTSFVFLDSDFQSSPTFAKQLQESLSYEFHRLGQTVIEVKSTGFIRVTPDGDFGLSTDFTDLKLKHDIDYVLVGTLAQKTSGVQVNAKLVGVNSSAIVAASHELIPQHYIDQYVPSDRELVVEGEDIEIIEPKPTSTNIKLVEGN